MNWKNALIRAARTFVQTFLGVWLAGVVAGPNFSDLVDIGLLETAAAAGIVSVVALVQNYLEELGAVNLGPRA
jgi:hypothetical protein